MENDIEGFVQFCHGIICSSRRLRATSGPDNLDVEMALMRLEMICRLVIVYLRNCRAGCTFRIPLCFSCCLMAVGWQLKVLEILIGSLPLFRSSSCHSLKQKQTTSQQQPATTIVLRVIRFCFKIEGWQLKLPSRDKLPRRISRTFSCQKAFLNQPSAIKQEEKHNKRNSKRKQG